MATKTVIAATATLIIFALAGRHIFMLFNITIPAFGIAGGLLLLMIAFSRLYGTTLGTKSTEKETQEAV